MTCFGIRTQPIGILVGIISVFASSGAWSEPIAPVLLRPEAGSSSVQPFPRFAWDRTDDGSSAGSPVRQEIEISRDAEFSDVVDRDRIDHLARYVTDRPLVPGTYYWRVRRHAREGEAGPWSRVANFTVRDCDEVIVVETNGRVEILTALREAVGRALAANKDGRTTRVVLAKGTYSLTPDTPKERFCLQLEGANGLILDFGGAELHVKRWGAEFLRMADCRDLTVMNATVDYSGELPFTQGVVVAKDAGRDSITIRIEPGFPELDAPHFRRAAGGFGFLMDPSIPGRMRAGTPIHFGFRGEGEEKPLGDRRWELRLSRPGLTGHFSEGDRFVKLARSDAGAGLARSDRCERLTYYNITSYGNGGTIQYASMFDNEIAVLHCRQAMREGRWLGANGDGIHARSHRVGPWIEGFDVNGIADDAIAFYTRPARMVAAHVGDDPRVFDFHPENFNLEVGDTVTFFDPRKGVHFASAAVVESRRVGDTYRVKFDRDLARPDRVGPDPKTDDQVWNRSRTCGDFMVRRSRLVNIRRYGVVFRALRGVVEDNHIEATSGSGIISLNEPYWPNGPMSSDIVIQNNRLINNCFDLNSSFGSVALMQNRLADDSGGREPFEAGEGRGNYQIVIRGNEINDWHRHALRVSGARDIIIEDNVIGPSGSPQIHDANVAVAIQNCIGIEFRRNEIAGGDPPESVFEVRQSDDIETDDDELAAAALDSGRPAGPR